MKHVSIRPNGYLLMEALIAMTLLVIGLTAFVEAFSLAHATQKRSRDENTAADCFQRSMLEGIGAANLPSSSCNGLEDRFEIVPQ